MIIIHLSGHLLYYSQYTGGHKNQHIWNIFVIIPSVAYGSILQEGGYHAYHHDQVWWQNIVLSVIVLIKTEKMGFVLNSFCTYAGGCFIWRVQWSAGGEEHVQTAPWNVGRGPSVYRHEAIYNALQIAHINDVI